MPGNWGSILAITATHILFLLIIIQAIALKRNWPVIKKCAEKGAAVLIIPFVIAAFFNGLAHRPSWSVILPLLAAFSLAVGIVLDFIVNSSKSYFVSVVFMGLFFIMGGMGMVVYSFTAGKITGFTALATMVAAGWAGFSNSLSR